METVFRVRMRRLDALAIDRGADVRHLTQRQLAREHDAFMEAGRAMGIEPPLDPIMGMIFLPLPVIPTLRIRPEGMFDVTTFSYAE